MSDHLKVSERLVSIEAIDAVVAALGRIEAITWYVARGIDDDPEATDAVLAIGDLLSGATAQLSKLTIGSGGDA